MPQRWVGKITSVIGSAILPMIALSIGTFSSAAFAEKTKVVVVPFGVGEGATDAQAAKFGKLVTEELKNRDELEVMPSPATRPDRPVTQKRSGAIAEANLAFDAGKKALADLKFDEAVTHLKKGVDAALSDPANTDYPAVIDAVISLAAAAFRQGDEKEAKAALAMLARLDPNYQLPANYPPVFAREFEKAKKKIDKSPKGTVSIDGPAGATAFIDGRDLGMLPVVEENLASGPHYVKVEGTKGERFGQTVELKGNTVKVKANFGRESRDDGKGGKDGGLPVEPRIAGSLDEDTRNKVLAYVKAAGADYALVAHVYRTGDQQLTAGSALFSAKKNGFQALTPVAFDDAVLTATVEAFKVADAVQQRMASFGGASGLPISLISKGARLASKNGAPTNTDDVEVTAADRKAVRNRTDLGPTESTTRRMEQKSNLVDDTDAQKPDDSGDGSQVKKGGVPVWVWVVVGVAVASGAAVGGYFGVKEATKPVTGTVTATW